MKEFLRRYKLTYLLYNIFRESALSYNVPLYRKFGLKKKYFSSISSTDFENIESPLNVHDEKDSAVELLNKNSFMALSAEIKEALLPWSKTGYVVLKQFFSTEKIDSINDEVNRLVDEKKANWRYQNKIMFAIHRSKILYDAGSGTRLMNLLELLLGKEVSLFQSINFLTASEQRTHSDSIHMSTFPYGNMIAVWIALEDTNLENGPLHYYPGSHKLPYIINKDYGNVGTKYRIGNKSYLEYENKIDQVVKANNFEKKVFLAKKGDVFIWHANLLHGGEPLLDKNLTRKSMVFHYYTTDAICYHEISQRPTLKDKINFDH